MREEHELQVLPAETGSSLGIFRTELLDRRRLPTEGLEEICRSYVLSSPRLPYGREPEEDEKLRAFRRDLVAVLDQIDVLGAQRVRRSAHGLA